VSNLRIISVREITVGTVSAGFRGGQVGGSILAPGASESIEE